MKNILFAFLFLHMWGCSKNSDRLPILGERETTTRTVDGKEVVDTLYHTIPDFKFVSQNGDTITAENFRDKIYVADFFFTTCPTICPVMKKQMLKVYEKIKGQNDVRILSHTIDPDHDTQAVLKEYAADLGVTGNQWLFVTGNREKIYEIGEKKYLVVAGADSTAPGGYIHSGAFVLVDKEKRVRGMYNGTDDEATKRLIADIERLREEYKKE
ncbi:SCO family protein [Runella slithyformis]|uniref:Electron transport protein SCO1/SenC n=1 Tax=Runella slithyformis (strain ATCC 29530 / DSM 19594 / LMG 11500 / NCIMB 11436 / LSU 4) TaxID=761193 RepID=A0A7U3ZNR1_RUNSL|nr:SCO family protein [Runella slithyformis]AEI50581.1 electron transport protein SCO1/SenC [Runella slithyformis DSM 19594]